MDNIAIVGGSFSPFMDSTGDRQFILDRLGIATELFFNEGQVKKNKTWGGESRVDTTLIRSSTDTAPRAAYWTASVP